MQMTQEVPASYRNTALRPRGIGLITEAAREIWSRRRLVGYLVRADIKKKGADTLLGNLWWLVDPLLQMLVYLILVSVIFARPQPDYGLFIFAAILPWKWFTSSVNDAITSVTGQERLIKQIAFPKIILPTASVGTGIINFSFGLIVLGALLVLVFSHRISVFLVWIPVIAAVQLVFTIAVAYVLSGVNVFFRDVGNISRHLLRLWFYLSPALYGAATVEKLAEQYPSIGALAKLNPFYILFTAYRDVIYGPEVAAAGSTGPVPPDVAALAALGGVSLLLMLVAVWFFKRLEPAFAKVL